MSGNPYHVLDRRQPMNQARAGMAAQRKFEPGRIAPRAGHDPTLDAARQAGVPQFGDTMPYSGKEKALTSEVATQHPQHSLPRTVPYTSEPTVTGYPRETVEYTKPREEESVLPPARERVTTVITEPVTRPREMVGERTLERTRENWPQEPTTTTTTTSTTPSVMDTTTAKLSDAAVATKDKAMDAASATKEKVMDAATATQEKATQVKEGVKETAGDIKEGIKSTAQGVTGYIGEKVGAVKDYVIGSTLVLDDPDPSIKENVEMYRSRSHTPTTTHKQTFGGSREESPTQSGGTKTGTTHGTHGHTHGGGNVGKMATTPRSHQSGATRGTHGVNATGNSDTRY